MIQGISKELHTTIRKCLLDYEEVFASDRSVKLLFVDKRISLWRNEIPTGSSNRERVDNIISFFHNKYTHDGQNLLILFLEILLDSILIDDSRTKTLETIISNLKIEFNNTNNKPDSWTLINSSDRNKLNDSIDWGSSADITSFYGREIEIQTLESWILNDKCRLVSIIGMRGIGKTKLSLKLGKGGIGKTDLSLFLAHGIQQKFNFIIWRSLLNAPDLSIILRDLISFVSIQTEVNIPRSIEDQISLLIRYMRETRSLIIFDNVEAVLQGGANTGQYKPGYDGYGYFFTQVGRIDHNSCVLITSREKPKEIALLEGNNRPVRSLELGGLDVDSTKKIFAEISSFTGSEQDWIDLNEFYDGNPLALELSAKHINEVFFGNIHNFLQYGKPIFYDLKELLDWHINRLSAEEKEIVYWLAINREPVTILELKGDVVSSQTKELIPSNIQSLQRKLPLEKTGDAFTLQPVLIEYLTDLVIHHASDEIKERNVEFINTFSFLKATAKDFVRETQNRLIVKVIIDRLLSVYSKKILIGEISQIINKTRAEAKLIPGYACGNLINLLVQLDTDLTGYDLSNLVLWQTYFQDVELQRVNLSNSDLNKSTFTELFSGVITVNISPQNDALAIGGVDQKVTIWSLPEGKQLQILNGHTDWIWSISFNQDGTQIASGSGDCTIKIWEVSSGICLKTIKAHDKAVKSVCFSSNGKYIASGSIDSKVKLWDADTAECIVTLDGHTQLIRQVTFNNSGTLLASASDDMTIKLWDVKSSKCLNTFSGHSSLVRSVVFTSDSKNLISSSDDFTIRIWNIETGECEKILQGHTGQVWTLAYNAINNIVVSGGTDQTIRVWDLNSERCMRILRGHTLWIRSLSFSSDGKVLASGSDDRTSRLWDVSNGQCLKVLSGYTNFVTSLAFSPVLENQLASGSFDKKVRIWDITTGQCVRAIKLPGITGCLAYNPDGKILAIGLADGTLKLYNSSNWEYIATLGGHTGTISSITFSADGRQLLTGSHDRSLKLWDVEFFHCMKTFIGHESLVWSVEFSPNGLSIASCSDDRAIRIWDIKTGDCLHELRGHQNWVRSLCYLNEDIIASCSDDQTIRIWDIKTETTQKVFVGSGSPIWKIKYYRRDNIIISGSEDHKIRLWDVNTGECVRTLEGHLGWIMGIAINSDDTLLASCGFDETIKIWDLYTRDCQRTLKSERPYERMVITNVRGLTEAQIITLKNLGAVVE